MQYESLGDQNRKNDVSFAGMLDEINQSAKRGTRPEPEHQTIDPTLKRGIEAHEHKRPQ